MADQTSQPESKRIRAFVSGRPKRSGPSESDMYRKYRNSADIRTALALQLRGISADSVKSPSPLRARAASCAAILSRGLAMLESRKDKMISFFIEAFRYLTLKIANAAEDEPRIQSGASPSVPRTPAPNDLQNLRDELTCDLQSALENGLLHLSVELKSEFLSAFQDDLRRLRENMNRLSLELDKASSQRDEMLRQLSRIEAYGYDSIRRVAIACGSDSLMIRTAVGYVLCPSTDYPLVSCLVDTGELERGTRLLIEKLVRPGDVFVDVGANIGLHTLAAARAMNGKGRIVALEPFEPTAQLLEKSIWMNGFSKIVEIHRAAASDHSGHQQLFLGLTCGHHSLFELGAAANPSAPTVEVPLVTLDEIMSSATADLLKIDAEGSEPEILDGSRRLIERSRNIAIIVEFGPSHLSRTKRSTKDWLSKYEAFGMIYRAINPDNGSLEEWSIDRLEAVESINLLFARPGATIWAALEG